MRGETHTDQKEFDKFVGCLPQEVLNAIEDPERDTRFIPVEKFGKTPDAKDPKKCNLSVEETRERIASGKNAGLYLGKLLAAIDVDQNDKLSEIWPDAKEMLDGGLCTETRSNGHHLILENKNIEKGTTYGDEDGEIAGLRTGWEYVLVPGSFAFDPDDGISGKYTVFTEEPPMTAKQEDLPPELNPANTAELENLDVDIDDLNGIDPSGITGFDGKTIAGLRESDEKLDALCESLNPSGYSFPSPSEADMAFASKLVWYEFEPEDIAKLFLAYRDRKKIRNRLKDYLLNRTIPKAIADTEKTVSDPVIQGLKEKISAYDRVSWNCEKEWVVATKEVELGDGKKVEFGDAYELPADLAEEAIDEKIAARGIWACEECGAYYYQKKKPRRCFKNEGCDSIDFEPLHPTGHAEAGDAIKNNYIFKTMNETGQIYYFDGRNRFRKKGAEMLIRSKTKEMVHSCKKHLQNEVVEHVRTSTNVPEDDFGLPKDRIAVENGILNLTEDELEELDPEEETPIARIPWSYDPKAECPEIKQFIREVVGEEDMKLIQEMFGYCLLKDYPKARAFMLTGGGANGKSTLLDLLIEFLGMENIATPSLQKLLENDFAGVRLYGRLANIKSDIPNKKLENTGQFKMLTGQDPIEGEQKYVQETVDFFNHAKLIYSANELPKTDDRTDAFFRRWIIIPCENHFPEDDPNTDSDLPYSIISEEEMSGLLNWALKGLHRVLEEGFSETASREEKKKEWFMDSDSLRAFVNEAIVEDPDGVILKKDLQNIYEDYCDHHGIYTAQKAQVTKRLRSIIPAAKGGPGEWYRPEVNGERPRCWRGIAVKKEFLEHDYIGGGYVPQGGGNVRRVRRMNTTTSEYVSKNNSKNNIDSYSKKSSSKTLDTPDTVVVEVTERFEHEGTTFEEGEKIVPGDDLPADAAEDALERGYVEEAGDSSKQWDIEGIKKDIIDLLKQGENLPRGEISDRLGIPEEVVSKALDQLYDEGRVEKGGKEVGGGMLYKFLDYGVEGS